MNETRTEGLNPRERENGGGESFLKTTYVTKTVP